MRGSEQTVLRDIVLVGGGHSHVVVLKMFAMKPWPGVRLTVICTDVHTPYSGMLPGYVAGHYTYDDVHIDLGRLCTFAGTRLFHSAVTGIDRVNKKVLCNNRPPVAYDVLSINVGSTPSVASVAGASSFVTPVKPIAQFNDRWLKLLEKVKTTVQPLRIAVVGGGAGGVELVLAMQYRLHNEVRQLGRNPDSLQFELFTAAAELLPTHNPWVRGHFVEVLARRGVHVHCNSAVVRVEGSALFIESGESFAADEVMWVTQAGGAAWLKDTGLETDGSGFLRVNDFLQTTLDPAVFAAGDIASMVNHPLEKAGVFAVRQGKPLAENLRRSVYGEPLEAYHPQRSWLALISTGDQHAVASRGWLGFAGDWVWRWKDWIDRRFMERFQTFPEMDASDMKTAASTPEVVLTQAESLQAISAIAMRCGGCGAKVGANVLSRALGALKPIERDDVLIGLHAPDDAAIVKVPPGKAMVHTVDFFRAFIDDPYVFGRVAANHALGDVFAMGGEPQSATAVVTVPPGLESKVEETLFQMMSGAVDVLNAAGCALVGGHTGEGKELALGFAINGLVDEDLSGVMVKGGMRAGDALILTKPIGTGTLFAAHAKFAAKGRWIDKALLSMQMSNQAGASCLRAFGAGACTDLTGCGLLGHLVEMTRPSGVDAHLYMSALPLLEGALETVAAGITSSLQPANVRLRRAIRNQAQWVEDPRYPLLFDPQTAGGLLATVPAQNADACVAALRALGYEYTAIIGKIVEQGEAVEPVVLYP